MPITKTLDSSREIEIRWGDTLQKVSQRELGDASRWIDIANINRLKPPYITGDPLETNDHVFLYGDSLIVPSGGRAISATTDTDEVFGKDIRLTKGKLTAENGDLSFAIGVDNLLQALENRVLTDKGELLYHKQYGSSVRRIIGRKGNSRSGDIASGFIQRAILSDARVGRIKSADISVSGDVMRADVSVETASGKTITLGIVNGFSA